MNLFKFRSGGVYKIINTQNNKVYYGQTSCFIRRCAQHLRLLSQKKHSCLKLQNEVNRYGLNVFSFEIIQEESHLTRRLKLEKQYLKQTPSNLLLNNKNVHNFHKKPRVAQRVKIKNSIFPSIAEAARILNKSSRTIRQKCDDISNNQYERLEYHRNGFYFDEYEVNINGQHFESTVAVVKAGFAITTRQVRDRCRSKKWQNWVLLKKEKEI